MLARTRTEEPWTANGSRSATRSRSATISGASMFARRSISRTRRRRCGRACQLSLTHRFSRSPTAQSSSSPPACPNRSLTSLKSSRSTKISTNRPSAHRIVEPLREQHPVGQSGERVVVHLMGESALRVIQLQGQPPLRANGDHLPDRDEEDHRQCRRDQDRVYLPTDQYVEGEQHRDAEEPAVGQDQLRPIHRVFVAAGCPPAPGIRAQRTPTSAGRARIRYRPRGHHLPHPRFSNRRPTCRMPQRSRCPPTAGGSSRGTGDPAR